MHNDPLIGRQLASFRVERLLGQGGMAHVYYGHDTKLDRPVAIKVIHPRYRDNASHTQRFVREAQAVAAWRHEHIIQIYYADDHDGLSYFVMEYIDGQDLSGLLSDYKRDAQLLPHADVLRIGRAVASALDYAHARGVIHRDVKPSNVFVARDGRVVLGDFGLALDLQEGTIGEVFGTPHYISPEQAHRSSNAVAQSDLYSLGIILYEMLTGGVPFDDASPTSVAVQHVTKAPPPPRTLNPGLSQATEQVLLKALSKEPGERYQSGAALIEALEVSLRAPAQAAPAQAASAQSGTDKIPTANLAATAPPAATAAQAAQPQRPPGSRSAKPLALGGVVAVLAIIAAIKLFAGAAAETDGSLPATAAATAASAAQQATQPPAEQPAGAAQQATQPPAATSAGAAQQATQPPAEQPQATTPPPSPTPQPASDKRVVLYYDQHTFYLVNHTGSTIPDVSAFAFERLSDDGQALNRFSGAQWPYRVLKDGRCNRVQAMGTPRLQHPADCSRESASLERNPARGFVFWSQQAGSSVFRVIWQGQEVGRCQIAAGSCEVFLP